jgi:hypothetical protein
MTNLMSQRILAILPVAGLAFLSACHSDSRENDIKPVRARIEIEGTSVPPTGPTVYMRVAASDNPDDDVVPLEIVLLPGGAPVVFDAFNIEILPTDPMNPGLARDGIVQMVFDTGAGTTPFGACSSCYATAGCGFVSPATPPACTACASCPADPDTMSVNSPLCFAATTSTHSFLATVAAVPSSGCAQASVASIASETVIATIPIFAKTTGQARLRFVDDPSKPGDCAILLAGVVVPVTFWDQQTATFIAAR